ncbi:MAG: peptidase M20 [Herpetosiphonaceae bacterium]|nr:MAG: peptidase M20 [Herpetosiphonaceae bacterium]
MVNADRLLQTFLDLVVLDNPSGSEEAIAQAVVTHLEQLGLSYERDEAGNIIARLTGEGDPLLLSAHMDSVPPAVGKRPVVRDGYVYSSGDTVLGADDLAGVAAILEAVRSVRESGKRHRAAELVFSVREEVGLQGAKALDCSRLRAREGVALDMTGPVGGVCVAAPSQNSFKATIHGKAAHAGVAPEAGINAIVVAAEAIAAMRLGRIDEETTANIGIIEGGSAPNIVPDRVLVRGEVRSRNPASLDAQTAAMCRALEETAARHGARVEIEVQRMYESYRIEPDAPLLRQLDQVIRSIGLEPKHIVTGGGSDVNIFNANGIVAANLSIGYEQIHSTEERIALQSLQDSARLVAALLTLV